MPSLQPETFLCGAGAGGGADRTAALLAPGGPAQAPLHTPKITTQLD